LERAICTGFCKIAKMELTLPTAIFIVVGQHCFFSLKARKETCFFFLNLVLCLTLLSNLEKQESIILWLINNIGCVN
jgi:hypothetical protein